MPQASPLSSDLPAPPPLPALSPEVVARLARLTRDYAELSMGRAGLSSLLGGVFLLLVALVEVAGHNWHFTWLGALSPLPLPAALGAALLPFLWLGARKRLHHWATERFGLVEALEDPASAPSRRERLRATVGRFILPGLMLLGLFPILAAPMSHRFVRASLVVALALVLHLTFPRVKGRMERFVAILLFFGPALLLSGIQMAAGDTLLAYPLAGSVAIALGCRDHLAFRRVKRELAALAGPA